MTDAAQSATPERWQREMRIDPPGPHVYQEIKVSWWPYRYCAVCEQTEPNCRAPDQRQQS